MIMIDKYCPQCNRQWVYSRVLGSVPNCQCSCIPVGTIRHEPVSKEELDAIQNIEDQTERTTYYHRIISARENKSW